MWLFIHARVKVIPCYGTLVERPTTLEYILAPNVLNVFKAVNVFKSGVRNMLIDAFILVLF